MFKDFEKLFKRKVNLIRPNKMKDARRKGHKLVNNDGKQVYDSMAFKKAISTF